MSPEQATKIGTQVIDGGVSEEQAFRAAIASGITCTRADIGRCVYEMAKERNPFRAAEYGAGNPCLYNDGRAIERPAEDALRAATGRALESPVAAALGDPFKASAHRRAFSELSSHRREAIRSLAGDDAAKQAEVWAAVAPSWGST